MQTMSEISVTLVREIASLSARLADDGKDENARTEALQLSRKLTASLEQPENVAVDLLFSVKKNLLPREDRLDYPTWNS
jgi:hypothetical protein